MFERWSQLLSETFRHHWLELTTIVLFVVCVWKTLSIQPIDDGILPGVAALGGLICTVAPDEVSDWTGYYGWTTQQYRNYPATFLRLLGVVLLASVLVYLW